jgi:hypothetical protein
VVLCLAKNHFSGIEPRVNRGSAHFRHTIPSGEKPNSS